MDVSVLHLLSAPDRLASLSAAGLLETAPQEAFEGATRLVRLCLGVPVALVTMVEADRQVLWGQRELPEPWCLIRQTPLSYSFCQYVVASQATLVVADAATHPIGAANLSVQDLGLAAYLGTPVRLPDGQTAGALCAVDGEPRAWSGYDVAVLQEIAAGVSREIASRLRGAHGRPSPTA